MRELIHQRSGQQSILDRSPPARSSSISAYLTRVASHTVSPSTSHTGLNPRLTYTNNHFDRQTFSLNPGNKFQSINQLSRGGNQNPGIFFSVRGPERFLFFIQVYDSFDSPMQWQPLHSSHSLACSLSLPITVSLTMYFYQVPA